LLPYGRQLTGDLDEALELQRESPGVNPGPVHTLRSKRGDQNDRSFGQGGADSHRYHRVDSSHPQDEVANPGLASFNLAGPDLRIHPNSRDNQYSLGRVLHLPAAAQSPVQLDNGKQLFAAQLSQEQLPLKQVALGVEHLQETVQAAAIAKG
jgi:hypothetical protein